MLFISHKTEDKDVANEVLRRALEHGYSAKQIFLDSDPGAGIEAGVAWERTIYESLKHTRAMIVLCSPNWLKSQWCFVELGYAKAMAISVFPIVIEPCQVGSTLSATQAVDLTRATNAAARDAAFERLWKALDAQHLGPKDNLPWPPPGETDHCPFPGLMCFDERHAPVFFGREPERDAVIQRLQGMRGNGVPRLLMIVGGSGSGKSSLLRAGVLPWLKHPTEQRDWLVLPTLRYGETPNDDVTLLARLAEVIAESYPPNHAQRPDWKELRDKFESADVERAARDFVDATLDLCQARRTTVETTALTTHSAPTLLLAIDQFEELLTAAARPSAQKFLRFLRTLLSRSNGRLLVIGTMRSDYLDIYEQHAESLKPPFLELYRLPPFPWERVTDVITKPAERVDVTFTEELITRLKGDAPNSDALPLLAFTLEKLFRQCAGDKVIELREYEQLGGMTGAITQAVTRILPIDMPKETEQALRRSFVNHLAQVNERDEFVRRRAHWDTLPDAAKPLLEEFVRRERLLQRSGNKGELVEVTHESIFRCWDQLKKWLQDALPVLHLRRRVEASAEEWQRSRNAANPQGDEGLLLTHAQLAALDEWLQQGDVALPECETTFVEASREKRKSDEQRELEQARQYAEAQAARAAAEAERAREAEKNQQLAESAQRQAEQHALADQAAAKRQRNLKHWAFIAAGATAVALCVALYLKVQADKATQAAIATLARSNYFLARARWNENRFGEAHDLLRSVPFAYRHFEWHYSRRQFENDMTLNGHADGVRSVSFSPDGKRIVSGSQDKTLKVWDAASGQETLTLKGHTDAVMSVSFSPDGKQIVSGSQDKTLKVWDAASGQETLTLKGHTDAVVSVSFSPDGKRIVSGSFDRTLKVWDAAGGQELLTLFTQTGVKRSVSFSPDGTHIVSGGGDFNIPGEINVWDAASGQKTLMLMGHALPVESVSFSPDGKQIVSGSWDNTVKVWDAAGGREKLTLKGHTGIVTSVSFSPDGKQIVSGSLDNTLKVWDAGGGQEPRTLKGQAGIVMSVSFSPDGKQIVSGSLDNTLTMWDAAGGQGPFTLKGHTGILSSVSFSPDGKRIVSGGGDGTLKVWDAASGRETLTLTGHQEPALSVSFSPDGKRIVSGSWDNTLKVWDAASGGEALTLKGHEDKVFSVHFSPDGKRIVSGSWDKTLKVWDAASGQEKLTLKGHEDKVLSVRFSPDGTRIVSGSYDKTLKVWDAANGRETLTMKGHAATVSSVSFSPDGKRIVSGGQDKTLKVWDATTGQELLTLTGHAGPVSSVSFSPDEKRIVSGGLDKTLKVWDATTGQELLTLSGHAGPVISVSFSPDGNRIVSGSEDDTLKIWDGTPKPWNERGVKHN